MIDFFLYKYKYYSLKVKKKKYKIISYLFFKHLFDVIVIFFNVIMFLIIYYKIDI